MSFFSFNRFGNRLTFLFSLIFILLLLGISFFVSRVIETKMLSQVEASLLAKAKLVENQIPTSDTPSEGVQDKVKHIATQTQSRITVIDISGKVIADSMRDLSQVKEMDNHRWRPEVRSAIEGRVGSSIRFSQTLQMKMFYVAVPMFKGGDVERVLRITLGLDKLNEILSSVRKPILIGLIFGVFVVLVMGFTVGASIRKRVEEMTLAATRYAKGDLSQKIMVQGSDELNVLADTMNKMAHILTKRISEIENERSKLSAILDNMTEGVIAVNSQRRLVLMNQSAKNIFGISQSDILAKPLLEIVKNQLIDQIVEKSIAQSKTISKEIEMNYPENKILKANAVGMQEVGREVSSILVIYDVTELRRLEMVRSEFVANVSHELKTPLTSIKGFIETLLGGALEDKEQSRKFLQMMDEDTKRLARLIDDILKLSNIESKEDDLNLKHLNLKQLVSSVVEILEPQSKEKKISIRNQIPDIQVQADEDKLRQVFLNLIDNAIKFNSEGGFVTLDINEIPGYYEISITDTGLGIPSEATSRVFERFFRVDKARSREMGGTGLGLSIVKHIVENHGGSVSCNSSIGEGATFYFTLPK